MLPECDENEYQCDDRQSHMPDPQAGLGQQVVWFRLARRPNTKDCGEKQHEDRPYGFARCADPMTGERQQLHSGPTIKASQNKSVIGFTSFGFPAGLRTDAAAVPGAQVGAPCRRNKKGLEPLPVRGHIFKYLLFYYSAASVSPAGTVSSESPMLPLTSMKLRRRLSSNARRRRA